MPLSPKIFNTLSKKKDQVKPIKNKQINMFVCGPTVYDFPHIGHAKLFITFDIFAKYLRHLGFNVFYLQNITDIDDKIIARAREKGVSPKDLAAAFEKEYLQSMKALGINGVSRYAKATRHIKEIISQVQRLEKLGFAYKIEDGVYYDISKFKKYGELSGRTALQAEDAVSRIDYSKDKKNRGDFCLWKFSAEGEPSWPAPFGAGRPGWHIEDTAITEKFFGSQYDIHGGARELLFPHHEAEVSQMEAISGRSPMVRQWMHIGVLTVNGQKMSKSLGNFIAINDFLKRCPANYLRFFVAKNLWRSPVDYSESVLIEVRSAIDKIEDFIIKLKSAKAPKSPKDLDALLKKVKNDFYGELADDFNTPKAFAVLFDFIRNANLLLDKDLVSKKQASDVYRFFEEINKIFGILNLKKINTPIPGKIRKLAKDRELFRKSQNWGKADEARMQIEKQGYTIEDTKSGPVIKRI